MIQLDLMLQTRRLGASIHPKMGPFWHSMDSVGLATPEIFNKTMFSNKGWMFPGFSRNRPVDPAIPLESSEVAPESPEYP